MSLPKFGPGDKIFAKVRGYPPWPARVEGVADETPNKMKYHIFFYGTGETGVCKQEEIFPYIENRLKYGKPMKKKGFNEALLEVDSELGLSPSVHQRGLQTSNDQESESEDNLVIDETPGKKSKASVSSNKNSETKLIKRKGESIDSDSLGKKPRKKSILSSDQESPSTSLKSTPVDPVVSRSGRKIKPKKFSGEVEQELDDVQQLTPKGTKQPTKSLVSVHVKSAADRPVDIELEAELMKNGTIIAHTPKGEEVRLKLNLIKPAIFKSDKARIEWETKLMENGKAIKAKIESGEILPENVKKVIHEKYQDKLLNLERRMGSDDKCEKLDSLKIEAKLLDLDVKIKSSLSLKQAEPELCLKHLDDMISLRISPLMIKKHPEIVDTIKKLRKYVGNISCWKYSEEQTHIFASKAAAVRSKAEHVYNKIKSLFLVPYGKSFWEVFGQEIDDFMQVTKSMKVDDVYSLTDDPTAKKISSEVEEETTVNSAA